MGSSRGLLSPSTPVALSASESMGDSENIRPTLGHSTPGSCDKRVGSYTTHPA